MDHKQANTDNTNDMVQALCLAPVLLVRLYEDGTEAALHRLSLMVLVLAVAYVWGGVFERRLLRAPVAAQAKFAMLFVVMLPGSLSFGGAVLAASFGWVFGREVFGGKALLSPALLALAFGIFSFPGGGYELFNVMYGDLNLTLALACVPGAVWLVWKKIIAWPVLVGAVVGVAAAALVLGSPGPVHVVMGVFSVGLVFIAAAPDCAPRSAWAQVAFGVFVGALVVVIRLANPDNPDGTVFALLLGGLFAPLMDRVFAGRTRHA